LEVKVSNFFSKVNYPVLTDLQLDLGGAQTDLIYPRGVPDVFRGSQVTLIGRYSNASDLESIHIKLTGRSAGTSRTYTYSNLSFPLRSESNDYLPRLWATRRVGWLMEQVRSNGEQKELRDEIVDLGTRYGIVTPYTSYLALEDAAATSSFSATPGQRQQNRARGGLRAPKSVMAPSPSASNSVSVVSGAEAIQQSKMARAQQEVVVVKDEASASVVRRVSGKTFYLVEEVWTDAEFKPESHLPETVLVFGSDDYFALLKQHAKLGSYFALGQRVVVLFDGRVYRVNAPSP
jgi:Ca-activated chloride channel family protein